MPMCCLKLKLALSKSKKTIEPTRSQKMATSRAFKSLVEESLLFIKQEPTTQPPITSFMTVSFLTQEPLYILSTIKPNSSMTLNLPQIIFTQAHIWKRLWAIALL